MEKIVLYDISLDKERLEHAEEFDQPIPAYGPDQLAPGRKVSMHFELALAEGNIVDTNFDKAPVEFVVGDGNLLPGFEQALYGLRAGDEKALSIPAEQAFGLHLEANVHTFSRYRFPADLSMEMGLMINFADSAGNDQPGVITEFDSSRVTIDFNHPLAGKDILFKVKIFSISTEQDKT